MHLSDTHFGFVPNNKPGLPHFDRDAHDVGMCQDLSSTLRYTGLLEQLQKNPACFLVVTGDLTSSGRAHEDVVAHSFLQSRWILERQQEVDIGLNIPSSKILTVPGNHDHHDTDKRRQRYNPAVFTRTFEQTPWEPRIISSASGLLDVEVFGIDSNSGWEKDSLELESLLTTKPYIEQWWRWVQYGHYSRHEKAMLEFLLQRTENRKPRAPHRVRILLSHHCISGKRELSKEERDPLGLEWVLGADVINYLRSKGLEWVAGQLIPESIEYLRSMVHRFHIAAVLTGHIHDSVVEVIEPTSEHKARGICWELRSPTVCQSGRAHWTNGFLVHHLDVDEGKVIWNVQRYRWSVERECFSPGPGVELTELLSD